MYEQMVLGMAAHWFANFKVDNKPLRAFFFSAKLLSLHRRLLILEKDSPKGTKCPISAHFAHRTAISFVPQLSPVVFTSFLTCCFSRYFEAIEKISHPGNS